MAQNESSRKCFYGYGGYSTVYCKTKNQEWDFEVEYSEFNENGTS